MTPDHIHIWINKALLCSCGSSQSTKCFVIGPAHSHPAPLFRQFCTIIFLHNVFPAMCFLPFPAMCFFALTNVAKGHYNQNVFIIFQSYTLSDCLICTDLKRFRMWRTAWQLLIRNCWTPLQRSSLSWHMFRKKSCCLLVREWHVQTAGKIIISPKVRKKNRNKPGLCTCNPGLLNLISLNSIFAFPAGG